MRHRAGSAAAALLLGWASAAFGVDVPGIRAEVACEPASGPGKIRCEVTVAAVGGALRWADAIVLSAPPFVPPLRNRLGSGDGRRDATAVRLPLALAATADGSGTLRVLARAVVCTDSGCRPVTAEASTPVVVGARGDAGP